MFEEAASYQLENQEDSIRYEYQIIDMNNFKIRSEYGGQHLLQAFCGQEYSFRINRRKIPPKHKNPDSSNFQYQTIIKLGEIDFVLKSLFSISNENFISFHCFLAFVTTYQLSI